MVFRVTITAFFTVYYLILFPAICQTIKPQVFPLKPAQMEWGCAYTLDDWRYNILAYNPLGGNYLRMVIDGQLRNIPILSRNTNTIYAQDKQYLVTISTSKWRKTSHESETAKAILTVEDIPKKTKTKLIVRAIYGC